MNPREAAYLAILASMRQEDFISNVLERWQSQDHPSPLDFAFAQEIALGSSRMALALDFFASRYSAKKKLSLKQKEKALLRMAIYQCCFMDKVPLYAVVNESVSLANKYCHSSFAKYLNALLRQFEAGIPELPSGYSVDELSIRLSYPRFFVEALINDYGLNTAVSIMEAENKPSRTFVRIRPGISPDLDKYHLRPIEKKDLSMAILEDSSLLSKVSSSSYFYIQNATPAALVYDLGLKTAAPKKILDLCASPGGKLLAAHDYFPNAALYANDVSEVKLRRLKENLEKYSVSAHLQCGRGEDYPLGDFFDLIILDVPCSNSGVLNKRPEARWRITPESLNELKMLQFKLIDHAAKLLSPEGAIWYMTCSILKKENEEFVSEASKRYGLEILYTRTILPNDTGWDGGFGCLLKPKHSNSRDVRVFMTVNSPGI